MEKIAELTRALERPGNPNRIYFENDTLVIAHGGDEREELALRKTFQPVDAQADENTRKLYQYMEAMGRSGSVMFGHQNDLWHKAGTKELSFSDTEDVTGELPAVVGMDALSLAGSEFTAEKYNRDFAGRAGIPEEKVDIAKLGSAYANVVAAAKLTNYMMSRGSVISLSAHMPNFTQISTIEGGEKWSQAYARYDFSHYTPNVLEGDVVNEIMPQGAYNNVYLAYLDMIADFAKLLNGPIMFRPFHENTGSWFWWGEAHCTPEEFKELFRYTVRYLRDTKGVHNLLYVYSPGSEPNSPQEFEIRYPGDDYVDMVGFDMYDRMAEKGMDEEFFRDFRRQLDILEQFARQHDRLMAVTETGLAADRPDEGDTATALHHTGNKNPRWYADVLDAVSKTSASYFLLWANFCKTGSFYTPFVEAVDDEGNKYGHEMLDDYIRYYNDRRSVFSDMQKDAVSKFYQR